MQRLFAVGLGCVLLSVVSCGQSTKELNEATARALLKATASTAHYTFPVAKIAPLMIRLPLTYATFAATIQSKGVKENVGAYIVKRLVDAKLVMEQIENASYPNIHGKFLAKSYDYDEYELDMVSNTNQVKGIRYQGPESRRHQSNITGTIDEKGIVTLPNGRFQYREDGPTAYLMDTDRINTKNYTGTATGTMSPMKFYVYIFSPELKHRSKRRQPWIQWDWRTARKRPSTSEPMKSEKCRASNSGLLLRSRRPRFPGAWY